MVTQYHGTAETDWFGGYHEMEHIDMLERNRALRDLIGGEVTNCYRPHDIFRNLQGYHRGPEAQQELSDR